MSPCSIVRLLYSPIRNVAFNAVAVPENELSVLFPLLERRRSVAFAARSFFRAQLDESVVCEIGLGCIKGALTRSTLPILLPVSLHYTCAPQFIGLLFSVRVNAHDDRS